MLSKWFSGAVSKTLIAAAIGLVAGLSAARASTVDVTGSLTVTLSSFDGNLPTLRTAPTDIKTFNGNQTPTSTYDPVFGTIHKSSGIKYTSTISLNVSLSGPGITTYNLFQIDPASSCGTHCTKDWTDYQDNGKIDMGTVTVNFVGTGSDSGQTFTDSGTFTAKYSGATLTCAASDNHSKNQTDCIQWGAPTTDTFTAITISLVNAVDWDLVPQIDLGVPGRQVTTPLPAALSLFGTGLGLMGVLGRRRRKRQTAAAV